MVIPGIVRIMRIFLPRNFYGCLLCLLAISYPYLVTAQETNNLFASESVRGESLFDELFLSSVDHSAQYEIPYPFDDLVLKLGRLLGTSVNGDANHVSSVLIPLGRCFNRQAASPEYFKYPRIVVSSGTEDNSSANLQGPFLKDRLFIGYQEKSNSFEVISYNRNAGRFEFQVVKDYAQGKQPVVEYADREFCTGCHQNQGPIFSQPPWDETDNNPEVFEMLGKALTDPALDPPLFRGSKVADVDSSTNRANKLSMYQQFWKSACPGASRRDKIRCRAGLAEIIINHRLQERSRAFPVSTFDFRFFNSSDHR